MKRILVIASEFNDLITRALLEGALTKFRSEGIDQASIDTVWVPGAFELPVAAAKGARSGDYSAVVCLGCVIRGETPHFDFVATEAARGIMDISVETGIPVIFGVLTTDTSTQALERCGLKGGNKGADAAGAALKMIKVLAQIEGRSHR